MVLNKDQQPPIQPTVTLYEKHGLIWLQVIVGGRRVALNLNATGPYAGGSCLVTLRKWAEEQLKCEATTKDKPA